MERICALSAKGKTDYDHGAAMETYKQSLNRLSDEVRRAYWHGYADPLRVACLAFCNARFYVRFAHFVPCGFDTILELLSLQFGSIGMR